MLARAAETGVTLLNHPNELHSGELCSDDITRYRHAFDANPAHRVALNAVTKTSIKDVALDRRAVIRNNHTFSHLVKAGAATSQERSGRCWMFAGLNLFRMAAAANMNLEDFELSQNYLFLWDKLEKSNFFLENILQTLEEETDGRLISWLMQSPLQDGGQWDMFVNLVKKYGVAPKTVMPETESSGSSHLMNDRVTNKLREYAAGMRQAHRDGASLEQLRARKAEMLAEVYRMLCIHLGEPPTDFEWQWRDKDKAFHRDGVVTPHEFYQRHVAYDLDGMVCLINCPTLEYNRLYTINYLGNVVGGHSVRYLNVEIEVMKSAAISMIKNGKPVWFGCDVGKSFDRDLGLMDIELFDYSGLYGATFHMSKAQRLDYGASLMTHAMVFTGVDIDDSERPRKWRVENSLGEKGGDKGFMVMTDAWFNEYNYEVVVEKQYVSPELLLILDTEPIGLPPWHPMGSLAVATYDVQTAS